MGLYKKVSDIYEAFRFTGDPKDPGWPEGWLLTHHVFEESRRGTVLILIDREGDNVARKGDWIVAGPRSSFRVVKGEAFVMLYEPLNPEEVGR